MKSRYLVTALAAVLTLTACSSGTPVAGSASVSTTAATASSTASATTTTSTPTSTRTTSTSTSRANPLVPICAIHCPKLKAINDLPACTTDAECGDQSHQAITEISALAKEFTNAGLSLSDYPEVGKAVDNYLEAARKWANDPDCSPMRFDGSIEAFGCGVELLTLKVTAGTTGLVLEGASLA